MKIEFVNKKYLVSMMALGYIIALTFVGFIILSVDQPKPEWNEYWFVRPLIITPIAGAFGGACCYLINTFSIQNSFAKTLTNTIKHTCIRILYMDRDYTWFRWYTLELIKKGITNCNPFLFYLK